jgi:membrane-bound lytic murein transglycosylase D
VGPWQFMQGTGKRYGLKVDYWIDERRDIVKSTRAAAKYLKELHTIFGSWYLAAAAYNAGEGRVLNAIRRGHTRNFWELARGKDNFRAETRNYVPKMIAAALISKNPEKYGFTEISYEQPLLWETVEVPQGVDLRTVAEQSQAEVEVVKLLNAELRIGITPPDSDEAYALRVPPEHKPLLLSNFDKLKSRKSSHFIVHHIQRGENLGSLARRFKTQVQTIMELNDIRNARTLRIGQQIRVPIPARGERSIASSSAPKRSRTRLSSTKKK